MIKILYFIESMGRGGKERRLYELLNNFHKDDSLSLSLILLRNENDFPDLNGFLNRRNAFFILQSRNWFVRLFRCYKFIKEIEPHVVHSWGSINSLIAVILKPFFGYKIVDSQITSAPKHVDVSVLFHKIPFVFSEVITSNSFAGLVSYKAPVHKSKVIYNGFDFERLSKVKSQCFIREQLGIATMYIVGMFANNTRAKNYELFFKIASIVLRNRENVTFICAGKGDFSRFNIDSSIRNRVIVMGPVSDVEQVMNSCDIGLQLTNSDGHGEGISNSILELCALGKCVVATNCGGTPEIIEDYVSGFLVDDDAQNISELLESLLEDDVRRNKIGDNARNIIREKFSIQKMVDEFKQIYIDCQSR